MRSIEADNARTAASKLSAAEFDRKAEKHFKSHPELKPGRDYRTNVFRYQVAGPEVAERFDETFAGSPDSPGWWEKEFCTGCGKRLSLCRCGK